MCDSPVEPGEDVRFLDSFGKKVVPCNRCNRAGIADPFVERTIQPGEQFWVFLEPVLVGNLVHSFSVAGLRDPHEPEPEYTTDAEEANDSCKGCYE